MFQRRKLLICGFLLTLSTMPGCASVQDKPQKGNTLELRQQELNATQFIEALYSKQMDKVLERSGYPFYLNHNAILGFEPEWRNILEGQFLNSPTTAIKIVSMRPYAFKEMEIEHPRELSKLMEHQFHEKTMLLLTVQQTLSNGQLQQENVLLFLDPYTGKIVGFII